MAGEISVSLITGRTLYAIAMNSNGLFWNTVTLAFEPYATANLSRYAIPMIGQGTASSFYLGAFPSVIIPGVYDLVAKDQLGASPAESDPTVGVEGGFQWQGNREMPLSDVATSGQLGMFGPIRLARGWMVQNYPLYLKSSADHVTPFTSGIISGQISKDGGSFTALQSGQFTEMGLGFYALQALTSGDLGATTVSLLFTGQSVSGGQADPLPQSFILQRVSGF